MEALQTLNNKPIIKSNWLKIMALIAITILIYLSWQKGGEVVYSKVLTFGANTVFGIVKPDSRIDVEQDKSGKYEFKVYTRIDGRRGSYPQSFGSLLQPFVIVLSWQLFLFLAMEKKRALKLLGVNIGIFLLIQIIFLFFLTSYYSSAFSKFMYDMMMDSFYIIALVLVIKDNIFYQVFRRIKTVGAQ